MKTIFVLLVSTLALAACQSGDGYSYQSSSSSGTASDGYSSDY